MRARQTEKRREKKKKRHSSEKGRMSDASDACKDIRERTNNKSQEREEPPLPLLATSSNNGHRRAIYRNDPATYNPLLYVYI